MSKKYSKSTSYSIILKRILRDNKDSIMDIMIFGSSVRGKEKPKDIDVLVLFKDKKNLTLVSDISKKLEKLGIKADVLGKKYYDIFSSTFLAREDILSDGYSIGLGKKLSSGFGYSGLILFKYHLSGMSGSERVRFHYALEGRGDEPGIIKRLGAKKFTTSVVLVPSEKSEKFIEFLEFWKIDYKKTRILIPEKTLRFMKF